MSILALIFLYIGLLLSGLLWSYKKDKFLEDDSDRCLNKFCELSEEVESEYIRRGYLYSKGLAIIEDKSTGECKFVKQIKRIH